MSTEQLVKMVNQIATNNSHQTQQESVALIVNHLTKFWALSMKKQIIDYAKQDGKDLLPLAMLSINELAKKYQ
ncbi:formate dehydrogenase subunit delta [Paraglaciecola aquimarina]|uniref:Formate dehydrogenase subunit delta n=1 Tax=Paraglaciecola aquimarina TaxID=1235557 RepID=A0ABU3ST22_9ALTE|nr:formate dehydrogenase subunit delta [Paraglaciecola aquimarina]MDU0353162.1 formate dehydrogenase subunit delta [Paraglaciecola aquimarina]